MIDFSDELGARAAERLKTEQIIWLTTTAPSGTPQPRPVWFLWDGEAMLIFSHPSAKKVEHIVRNPSVALHFNSAPDGDDIQVFLAMATIDPNPMPPAQMEEFLTKYREGIVALGMTEEALIETYSTLIRAVPTKLRGV